MIYRSLILVLFLAIPLFAAAQSKDIELVKRILIQQSVDWNKGDIDAFMEYYFLLARKDSSRVYLLIPHCPAIKTPRISRPISNTSCWIDVDTHGLALRVAETDFMPHHLVQAAGIGRDGMIFKRSDIG